MEYVEDRRSRSSRGGRTAAGGPFRWRFHLYVLIEILSALEYAHSLTERDGTRRGSCIGT